MVLRSFLKYSETAFVDVIKNVEKEQEMFRIFSKKVAFMVSVLVNSACFGSCHQSRSAVSSLGEKLINSVSGKRLNEVDIASVVQLADKYAKVCKQERNKLPFRSPEFMVWHNRLENTVFLENCLTNIQVLLETTPVNTNANKSRDRIIEELRYASRVLCVVLTPLIDDVFQKAGVSTGNSPNK